MRVGELFMQVWRVKISDTKRLDEVRQSSPALLLSCFLQISARPRCISSYIKLWDTDMRAFYLKINKNHDFSLKALLQAQRIVGDYLNSAKLSFFLATGNRRNLFSAQAWKQCESSHNTHLQPILLLMGLYLLAWQLVLFMNEDSLGVSLTFPA